MNARDAIMHPCGIEMNAPDVFMQSLSFAQGDRTLRSAGTSGGAGPQQWTRVRRGTGVLLLRHG
ncbi:MAG: hypothetical protein EDS66_03925 [Planctomycetota bacterium]|nr:MAG: hypothetical protein EDS66_03925 [Planctomycetota bacterium]MCQ3920703.1 hypothetical protein [Planctomycetota bacterium]